MSIELTRDQLLAGGRYERGGGFVVYRPGGADTLEIFDIEVSSESRRQGVGRRMVYDIIDSAEAAGIRTVFAITRASNHIAQLFYQELRFRPILLWDFYKDEPLHNSMPNRRYADAIMYVKDIGSQA